MNIELLAPAGNLEKLKTAILYGADAVYIGGEAYSLRAMADNFGDEEMKEALEFAHSRGKKIYVTLNIFAHNADLQGIPEYVKKLNDFGVDAVIVSDMGIFSIVREVCPDMDIHISTQANSTNYKTAQMWQSLGATRIVLARELSLNEIKQISQNIPDTLELEAFIHGAMCMSYSGRCLLSNYMTGRDANRGACAHPCRYKYYLMEEKRPGEYFEIQEDARGAYIMNSMDLCMIEHIPDIIESGITSLKIEGRMKSAYYVASVVKAYREAIDEYIKNPTGWKFKQEWLKELSKSSHRQFSTGFYYGKPKSQVYESSDYIRTHDIVGIVRSYDNDTNIAQIEQRNKVLKGETVEILSPDKESFDLKLDNIMDMDGNELDSTPHPQMIYSIKTSRALKPFDMLVKEKGDK